MSTNGPHHASMSLAQPFTALHKLADGSAWPDGRLAQLAAKIDDALAGESLSAEGVAYVTTFHLMAGLGIEGADIAAAAGSVQ